MRFGTCTSAILGPCRYREMAVALAAAACLPAPAVYVRHRSAALTVTACSRRGSREGRSRLVVEMPKETWAAGEPIEGVATLSLGVQHSADERGLHR